MISLIVQKFVSNYYSKSLHGPRSQENQLLISPVYTLLFVVWHILLLKLRTDNNIYPSNSNYSKTYY